MKKSTTRSLFPVKSLHPNWIVLLVLILAGLALAVGAPAWAATAPVDRSQTIPAPTPTSEPLPPTPTPKKDDDDDGAPTPTPTPSHGAPQEPPAGPALSGVVVPEMANVRGGPGTSFPVIGKLMNNDRVDVLFRDQTGAWWFICCTQPSQQEGWVSASLIRPDFDPAQANQLILVAPSLPTTPMPITVTPTATIPGGELRATVNAERLSMRSGPGTDFPIVAKLERGNAVAVLGRNERGDWWYVCCAPDALTRGWVSAPYMTPAFDQAAALQLIPLFTDASLALTGTQTITGSASTTMTVIASAVTPTTTVLSAAMRLNPPFVLQGERAQIVITVTNTTPVTATDVAVRNELYPALAFVGAAAQGGSAAQETMDSGAVVITSLWDEIGPSSQVSATITVHIADDLPDGSVVDNLAAMTADNADDVTFGMLIGMPPVAPPDFR